MRYAHMVNVYESLGWIVEETKTGIAVMAGPVDPESDYGYIRIDVEVGAMDDRKKALEDAARELADKMLLVTWSIVSNHEPDRVPADTEDKPESNIILPFAVPTGPGGAS